MAFKEVAAASVLGLFRGQNIQVQDAKLKKVKDAGGKVIREPWDVPGVGKIAIVSDPLGAMQGWMVPAPGGM